jgi:hypothetical protein
MDTNTNRLTNERRYPDGLNHIAADRMADSVYTDVPEGEHWSIVADYLCGQGVDLDTANLSAIERNPWMTTAEIDAAVEELLA